MAATGRDGGRGLSVPWRYRLRVQTGRSNSYDNSISSSSSGTIVSTTYTSNGSRLSSISMDAVRHFELALEADWLVEDTELVRPAKKSCIEREEVVLERWFAELDIAWVLHLTDAEGDDASAELHHTSADAAERWIWGLQRILNAIPSTSTVFSGLSHVYKEEDQHVTESDKQANNVPDPIHFARFTKEAMSKMLPFVDFAIRQETVSLVSAKKEEASEAIWSTMEPIRTRVLESIDIEYVDGSSSSVIPQASSDIHKATLSVMEYINVLCSNSSSMCRIVSKAVCLGKYVPQIRQEQPMDSMVMDMVSCLQEKLVKMSESFPDQGLRFLFWLNNLEFTRQSLMDNHFCYWLLYHKKGEGLSEKIVGYMENYLQACWEPVLSCLFSPTPLCFGINHSPLLKFETEFKKTYATQKLWKVPDPKLRERLRRAITKKIVPRYTEYMEENNMSGVTPRDLEMMLQELFEG